MKGGTRTVDEQLQCILLFVLSCMINQFATNFNRPIREYTCYWGNSSHLDPLPSLAMPAYLVTGFGDVSAMSADEEKREGERSLSAAFGLVYI